MEQIRDKYISLSSISNTIDNPVPDNVEPVKDRKFKEENPNENMMSWEVDSIYISKNIAKDFFNAGYDYRSSLTPDSIEIFGKNAQPDFEDFLKQYNLESKLNNTIEEKSQLLCAGRIVKVDTEYYTVTSEMKLSDSILFNLQNSNGSLRFEIKK